MSLTCADAPRLDEAHRPKQQRRNRHLTTDQEFIDTPTNTQWALGDLPTFISARNTSRDKNITPLDNNDSPRCRIAGDRIVSPVAC
jgi:hypothetical protein